MRKTALALSALLLVGCNLSLQDQWYDRSVMATDTRMLAQMRRAQVIADIERLQIVLRRTSLIDNRIVIQSQINGYQSELNGLNTLLTQ